MLKLGSIVWAEVSDPSGHNPKCRPLVVIREITDSSYLAVAASTKVPEPLRSDMVLLPFARNGSCNTGLRSKTVAVCSWVMIIQESSIQEVGGFVPKQKVAEILERLPR